MEPISFKVTDSAVHPNLASYLDLNGRMIELNERVSTIRLAYAHAKDKPAFLESLPKGSGIASSIPNSVNVTNVSVEELPAVVVETHGDRNDNGRGSFVYSPVFIPVNPLFIGEWSVDISEAKYSLMNVTNNMLKSGWSDQSNYVRYWISPIFIDGPPEVAQTESRLSTLFGFRKKAESETAVRKQRALQLRLEYQVNASNRIERLILDAQMIPTPAGLVSNGNAYMNATLNYTSDEPLNLIFDARRIAAPFRADNDRIIISGQFPRNMSISTNAINRFLHGETDSQNRNFYLADIAASEVFERFNSGNRKLDVDRTLKGIMRVFGSGSLRELQGYSQVYFH